MANLANRLIFEGAFFAYFTKIYGDDLLKYFLLLYECFLNNLFKTVYFLSAWFLF